MNQPRMVPYTVIPRETTTLQPAQIHKGFVFAPLYRSASRPGDAHTFQNRARQFCSLYGLQAPLLFDNDGDNDRQHLADDSRLATRRNEILDALNACSGPLDLVAYFGHGAPHGLLSAGISGPVATRVFAEAIARKASPRMVVVLNACSCGRPGGFAEELCRELIARGVRATVFGHDVPGHATNNPTKRRYPGGSYLIEPGSSSYNGWRQALWNSDLWARYPFMEPDALARAI